MKRRREGLCLTLLRNALMALTGQIGECVAAIGRVEVTM